MGELLCVGQGQQLAQGLPSLCPPAEDDTQAAAYQPVQQPGASAELVDGYQLHITGDAMDAVQSSVCANAQVCMSCFVIKIVHCGASACLPECAHL